MAITTGTIQVFTFKEGLLSKVAHDLRLTLGQFEIDFDPESGSISGRFSPATLTVDGAMRDGRVDEGALKPKDKREIQGNIQKKILHTARHPEAVFTGSLDGTKVSGDLSLAGRTAPLDFTATVTDGRIRGRATLVPTRWGIQPYKALLGAIKLQDRVEVTFDLPAI